MTNTPHDGHDPVDHPAHYTSHPSGVECIDVTQHMNFCLGNAVKYIWRAGLKNGAADVEDLRKAVWYLEREIRRLTTEAPVTGRAADEDPSRTSTRTLMDRAGRRVDEALDLIASRGVQVATVETRLNRSDGFWKCLAEVEVGCSLQEAGDRVFDALNETYATAARHRDSLDVHLSDGIVLTIKEKSHDRD